MDAAVDSFFWHMPEHSSEHSIKTARHEHDVSAPEDDDNEHQYEAWAYPSDRPKTAPIRRAVASSFASPQRTPSAYTFVPITQPNNNGQSDLNNTAHSTRLEMPSEELPEHDIGRVETTTSVFKDIFSSAPPAASETSPRPSFLKRRSTLEPIPQQKQSDNGVSSRAERRERKMLSGSQRGAPLGSSINETWWCDTDSASTIRSNTSPIIPGGVHGSERAVDGSKWLLPGQGFRISAAQISPKTNLKRQRSESPPRMGDNDLSSAYFNPRVTIASGASVLEGGEQDKQLSSPHKKHKQQDKQLSSPQHGNPFGIDLSGSAGIATKLRLSFESSPLELSPHVAEALSPSPSPSEDSSTVSEIFGIAGFPECLSAHDSPINMSGALIDREDDEMKTRHGTPSLDIVASVDDFFETRAFLTPSPTTMGNAARFDSPQRPIIDMMIPSSMPTSSKVRNSGSRLYFS